MTYDPCDWRGNRNDALDFMEHAEGCIDDALAEKNARFLTDEDRAHLQYMRGKARRAFEAIEAAFVPFRDSRPADAVMAYKQLWNFAAAMFVGGSLGTVSDSAKVYAKLSRQKTNSKKNRPGARSPFKKFIREILEANPSATDKQIKQAFLDSDFFDIVDGTIFYKETKIKNGEMTSKTLDLEKGLPAAISKVRGELKNI